jgi:hypothetical protein
MKKFIVLLGLVLINCGGMPYQSCTQLEAHKQSCINNEVVMCDGNYWEPIMNCSEQWGSNGELLEMTCSSSDAKAVCE